MASMASIAPCYGPLDEWMALDAPSEPERIIPTRDAPDETLRTRRSDASNTSRHVILFVPRQDQAGQPTANRSSRSCFLGRAAPAPSFQKFPISSFQTAERGRIDRLRRLEKERLAYGGERASPRYWEGAREPASGISAPTTITSNISIDPTYPGQA
ncbi:hypothetical protein K432DRAFT_382147 [Lepidopterella palustris CBS 459.81]|uniref:Uncharacterized protein n=1 Tax=Lepidopterella palustris CBS 459.81 TaxID=1314670 RepID=A0A8E2EB26_9PEZI|nr:hypothetical protein K432DRAFT_382147 [Lepidopterella palustris CBS 459.81]